LLYLTYCRPWFVEYLNFNTKGNPKQKPLLIKNNLLSGLSEQHQRLLVRALRPYQSSEPSKFSGIQKRNQSVE
jgi:hypothetical protein